MNMYEGVPVSVGGLGLEFVLFKKATVFLQAMRLGLGLIYGSG